MALTLVPVDLATARRYVAEHHSHNGPPVSWRFGVGVDADGEMAGVGIAGRPVARGFDPNRTLEITRVCTLGERNACSMIYAALCRAGAALGYRQAVTYTLASECASCVKGAGFEKDAELEARATWDGGARHRVQTDLFGRERRPPEPKVRWHRRLST